MRVRWRQSAAPTTSTIAPRMVRCGRPGPIWPCSARGWSTCHESSNVVVVVVARPGPQRREISRVVPGEGFDEAVCDILALDVKKFLIILFAQPWKKCPPGGTHHTEPEYKTTCLLLLCHSFLPGPRSRTPFPSIYSAGSDRNVNSARQAYTLTPWPARTRKGSSVDGEQAQPKKKWHIPPASVAINLLEPWLRSNIDDT